MMETAAHEFSRSVPLDRILSRPVTREIEATPAERAAVANRLGVVAIDRLTATVTLCRRASGTVIAVDGTVRTHITQRCVVSLEPFSIDVEEPFAVTLSERLDDMGEDGGVDIEDPNAPEPVEGDVVDIGELAVQYLSLALDPYPRAPGVSFEEPPHGGDEPSMPGEGDQNPFAVLARLKRPE